MRACSLFRFVLSYGIEVNLAPFYMGTRMYNTCFAFYCISAVLRDRCWFYCSVLAATVINEHYYYCSF